MNSNKFLTVWLCFPAIAVLSTASIAADKGIDSPYEIGTWAHFCDGAISHTFDDNTTQQTGDGQAAFDEKGFHMTLFVVTGWGPDWNELNDAFETGHEIASHTTDHSSSSQGFRDAWEIIREKVPGEMCITIAYPNCQQNGVTISPYYIAGRNCDGQINSSTPQNFEQVSSILTGSGNQGYSPNLNTTSQLNQIADNAISQKGWAVTCNHGVGNDGHTFANTDLDALKGHLDYLDQNRDKIWCETFGNVARYIKERDAASVSETASDDNSFTVDITDNLADSIFDYPLSIRRPLPEDWDKEKVTATQNGDSIACEIATNGSDQFILFEAVPDKGDVVISSGATGIKNRLLKNSSINVIQIHKNRIVIATDKFAGSHITVQLLNLKGEQIAHHVVKGGTTRSGINLSDKMTQSAFIVKVTDGKASYVEKIVPRL